MRDSREYICWKGSVERVGFKLIDPASYFLRVPRWVDRVRGEEHAPKIEMEAQ